MNALVVAACTYGAIALVRPTTGRIGPQSDSDAMERSTVRAERGVLLNLRPLLCALAVVAGWVVVGGVLGLTLGLAGAAVSWRVLERLESPATVRRRRELERDLPVAVHLLGACLAAGSATGTALASVAASMPGAVGEELALLQRRLHWGIDPISVWRTVDGPLEPLGRSMARAHESGASVQAAVLRLAEDLRNETRARADARARSVEVRAAGPLGLCFLPAFVLLGVVPMAAGLISSLALFR